MKRILLALVPVVLAACAAAPTPSANPTVADADTICEREARTGTILPSTRCRTAEQRKEERAAVNSAEENRRNFQGLTTGK